MPLEITHSTNNPIELRTMARKIEIGTTFTGQDAIDFAKYMQNPTYTERSNEIMKKIIREYEEGKRLEY